MFLKIRIAFENDRILRSFQELITVYIASERHEFPIDFESISHRDILWMTRKRNNVT